VSHNNTIQNLRDEYSTGQAKATNFIASKIDFLGQLGASIILMEAKNVQSLVLDIVNLPESDSGTQLPPKNLFKVL